MIVAPEARSLLGQVTSLAEALHAEVELRCMCRCRCHKSIGWATNAAMPCRGVIDAERLDCAYGCRGERGCELAPVEPPALAHV